MTVGPATAMTFIETRLLLFPARFAPLGSSEATLLIELLISLGVLELALAVNTLYKLAWHSSLCARLYEVFILREQARLYPLREEMLRLPR